MEPTGAASASSWDEAIVIDDDDQEGQMAEEGRSALPAALRAAIPAATSAEQKQSDSSSSLAESKSMEDAMGANPPPAAHRSKRVREPQAEAAAAAAAAPASSSRSAKQARSAAASSVQQQQFDLASAGELESGSLEYEVESILDQRTRHGQLGFQVKWTGYDDPTWQPAHDLDGAAEMIAEFQRQWAPPAAAAAASSSAPKHKPAAAAASSNSAASSAAAALQAAARPSPCSRLDADSLGIALSCLDANEFLVARLVSKQWHAASAKRTAWPQLHVDDFIRLMQTGSYDNSSRRRLVVNTDTKLRSFVQRFSAQPSKDVFGKHASEIKFAMRVPCAPSLFAERKTLLHSALPFLSQFQYLSTLTLHHCFLEDAAVVQLYTALEPRLRVLILLGCGNPAFLHKLSLLTQLRVLVVLDDVPPAEALRSLTSLRYFHVRLPRSRWNVPSSITSNHGRVLRWLSVNHALRSLSIQRPRQGWNSVHLDELVALTEADATRLVNYYWGRAATIALDPPLDWEVPARFTDLSIGDLASEFKGHWNSMPDLRRLEFEFTITPMPRLLHDGLSPVLQRLTEIRIIGRFSAQQVLSVQTVMEELQTCRNLRRLTFTTNILTGERAKPGDVAPIPFPPLLGAFSATIEEIRLGVDIRIAFQADGENEESTPVTTGAWAALAACKQLRVLGISFSTSMPDSFLRALSSLPVFRSLELSFRGDQPRMPPTMLRRMLESTSWNVLRLESVGSPSPCAFNPLQPAHVDGLSPQLARLQAKDPAMLADKRSDRIRLFATDQWRAALTYCIVTNESSGARVWESDERR